ncbi:MAG TPA: glycoside hydrolase family 28 protein [Woeseiaceae bacterium]|nr:glycoside hydrolase family 28 protein [Woeseiaceae bacterium]
MARRIRDYVVVPTFPDRTFDIRDYGAAGDGAMDCTDAFRQAVAACAEAGGGRVLVSEGTYRTGPIHLRSNVNLHVAAGATVSFIPEPERYLPPVFTRWEGVELLGYSPLIYAHRQENVAVTGAGTLDGSADNTTWWPWKGEWSRRQWEVDEVVNQKHARAKLFQAAEDGVPVAGRVFAGGNYLRPPFLQPYECRKVLIEGVTIRNSPFWVIHPVLCESVTVRRVTVDSHGPNSDGCDPESCDHVLIEDCVFDTGDDCIAIKSGRNADGRRVGVPCRNVVIAGCTMRAGHGGIVVGSEISGGAANIFAEKCAMSSPNLLRGIRIKTNSRRGGTVEGVHIRDVTIGDVGDMLVINFYYEEGDVGEFDPVVRDVTIESLRCRQAERAFHVRGYERSPIRDLRLVDVQVDAVEQDGVVENVVGFRTDNVTVAGRPVDGRRLVAGAEVV